MRRTDGDFAAELRCALVADREGHIGCAVVAGEQQMSRFLQSELFVILKRAETGYRQKMAMQAGAAHAACIA